ncbi:PepSY domain-containing protein [Barrientosiimonas marina]|uniref:PepSY domain-containing protein n=1 Tax=Lentibacillus kimchii TaxID=1542911 RepID=A0ABW2UWW8_9BACI
MKARNAIIGASAGIATGFLVKRQLDRYQTITPEKALKQAKESFKKEGPISGSWIYMKPEEIEKDGLMYNTYRGGVTRNIDGASQQYEFYIDIDTGAIIDSIETAS